MVSVFLKQIEIFSELSDDDIDHLCDLIEIVFVKKGTVLFNEGDTAEKAYVIKNGELEVLKASGDRQVLLGVRKVGEIVGEIALFEEGTRTSTIRVRTNCTLIAIGKEMIDRLLERSPHASRAMFNIITSRMRARQSLLRQSERMAQLGTLSAGLAHELNNPASAVSRSSEQLQMAMDELNIVQQDLMELDLSKELVIDIEELSMRARKQGLKPLEFDSLERSDKEYELEETLAEMNIDNGWELAPSLVNLSLSKDDLQDLSEKFGRDIFSTVIKLLDKVYTVYNLMHEIKLGSGRISSIVRALKQYSYLDQAPIQEVDIHEGLNNTLLILRNKLKYGVNIIREFDPQLTKIQAYGSELNQVWTNLIDNAIDAMDGKGKLTIRTKNLEDCIQIEIEDNGPGIPSDVIDKIFDPFFTTKAPGKGTGLGLDISYNIIVAKHNGELKVVSQPGKTIFIAQLPLDPEADPLATIETNILLHPDDETLLKILNTQKTIAVVGISNNKDRPGNSIPKFLLNKGYEIIGVNPNFDTFEGNRVYSSLSSIEKQIDTVLIFRQSDHVPKIVDEAIELNVKTIWMQEGIIHENAGHHAQNLGVNVVMDSCMRLVYKRLKSNQ